MDDRLREETIARLKTHQSVASVEFVDALVAKVVLRVQLAQDDISKGVSFTGVRSQEEVTFIFDEDYPCSAVSLRLRRDFPRDFPHINPSEKDVIPCVFEGKVSELLQQPKGLLGLVDQIVSWLNKAAVGGLMNPDQGWEYMRTDRSLGSVNFALSNFQARYSRSGCLEFIKISKIGKSSNPYFGMCPDFTSGAHAIEGLPTTPCVFYVAPVSSVGDRYCPFAIDTYKQLKRFLRDYVQAQPKAIRDIDSYCNTIDEGQNDLVFIVGVRRPYHLIGTDYKIEFLGFHVDISTRNDTGKGIESVSKVSSLSLPEVASAKLLKRLSGHEHECAGRIIQLGCGSLGSKIVSHLARNGNSRFLLVDNATYYPHNNARHVCASFFNDAKTSMLQRHVIDLGVNAEVESDYKRAALSARTRDLIVDSLASICARNWLAVADVGCRIIHTAMYNRGKVGLCLLEGADRNPRIDDLFATVMRSTVKPIAGVECPIEFAAKDFESVGLGQGCSSYTTVMDDALISLHAAGMARKIQGCIDTEFPEDGRCSFSVCEDGCSVDWNELRVGKTFVCETVRLDGYQVRVLSCAIEDVEKEQEKAGEDETGGLLCASVNESTRTITVVACLPPPPDSRSGPCYFELGQDGVKDQIRQLQTVTGNCLTSVGTWHTHPHGGSASSTDRRTYDKLFKYRKFPTLCLIWKSDGTLEFLPDER